MAGHLAQRGLCLVSGRQFLDEGIAHAQVADLIDENFPPIGSPPSSNLFNGAVYLRGSLVLHALRLEVGDQTFFDGMRTYVERFAYGTATTDDFIAVANEVAGRDLGDLIRAWTYEDLPPLP